VLCWTFEKSTLNYFSITPAQQQISDVNAIIKKLNMKRILSPFNCVISILLILVIVAFFQVFLGNGITIAYVLAYL